MLAYSEQEQQLLAPDSSNFVSWYKHVSLDQGLSTDLNNTLPEVLDGFAHLKFVSLGESYQGLDIRFHDASNGKKEPIGYTFKELSDGQRALIALYALLVYAKRERYILCLDEPENFLALPEIQPWLIKMYDLCNEGRMQALIISHHPEMINYLATESGIWFERVDNGPVTAQPVVDEADTGLPISELVARGWIGA
jgi:predicted ATPase